MRNHPPQKRTLDSFLSTPIKTYQAIRFDMNANATMNVDRAAVDIDEPSKSAMTIMTLPPELRDFIYEGVVGTKYRIDARQIENGAPHSSEPPLPPETFSNSSTPSNNPATRQLRFVTRGTYSYKSGEVPYKYPFPPRPSLSILQASTRVRQEALQVLYQKGALLFVLNHPSHSHSSHSFRLSSQCQELIKNFNNVEIFLDLASMFNHSPESREEKRAIRVTMELIERIANIASVAGTCTLSTYYRYDDNIFEICFLKYLLGTASKLCVFKKLVLRFGNRFKTAKDHTRSSAELAAERASTDEWAVEIYRQFSREEEFWCLGPCEESYDSEGFYCLVFYPKDQSGKGGSSKSGSD